MPSILDGNLTANVGSGGGGMHRVVLVLGALCAFLEAWVFGAAFYFLGSMIDQYHVSMGGRPSDEGKIAVWVLAVLFAIGLTILAVPMAVGAVRGRRLGRTGRGLAIAALIVHGALGIGVVFSGSAVWFAVILCLFCVLLLGLVLEPARVPAHATA